MDRVVCLDYGDVRIGVAVSDPFGWTAQPLAYVPHNEQVWDALKVVIERYESRIVVLGLPKNLQGDDSNKAIQVRAFGEQLQERLGIAPIYRDERLSSKAATKHLLGLNVSRDKRKQLIDSQSAAFVLQGYLDEMSKKA